ncbi:MAG: hypothetical protein GY809_14855 [Planctomycetes bacterium]|nr:hypothetical protein [Planctomycetota bacterium]
MNNANQTRIEMVCMLLTLCLHVAAQAAGLGTFPVYNIENHGAVGDGTTLNTQAIQKAIDQAAGAGGGTVFFPPGN